MILQTERLILREMTQQDYPSLCKIIQDPVVMYAYEGPFNDIEAQSWLDKQLDNYKQLGFGLWAVVLKETNQMIGQCGLTMQQYKDSIVLEIGYLFQKDFWGKGYATEAAIGCKQYAFDMLKVPIVYSIIRDNNIPSQNVAIRNNMTKIDTIMKHYRNIDMPHYIYAIKKT